MQIYDISIDSSQQETTIHGSFDFPLAVYETVLRKNVLGFVNWHWHREFQFCLVTSGTVDFYVQRQQLSLRTGDGIFINSNVLHMARPGSSDAAYCCIDVLPSLLGGFSGSLLDIAFVTPLSQDASLPFSVFSGDEAQPEIALLRQIRSNASVSPSALALSITGQLMQLCQAIISSHKTPAAPHEDLHWLQQVLKYIDVHYSEKLTLAQCAALANLSASEFCRQFRRLTQYTLTSYIRQVRIQKSAAALLLHPDKSISQISYESGFSTTSYFISQFRQATGMTPLAYRKTRSAGEHSTV